jgi:hypothetical protein
MTKKTPASRPKAAQPHAIVLKTDQADIMRGLQAIGEFIDQPIEVAGYLLFAAHLPGWKSPDGEWEASRNAIRDRLNLLRERGWTTFGDRPK